MAFDLGGMLKGALGGLGKLFGQGGGQAAGNVGSGGVNIASQPLSQAAGGGAGSGFNWGKFLGSSGAQGVAGLGTMLGSQMIKNPKAPEMPQEFEQYKQMSQMGGSPLAQSSQQYMQSLISGQNTAANDAATYSLDMNYQEQLRQLNAMYKSLRPGTDPTSDSTYQRDLSNLNDQYSRARAQVLAQQQMAAAGQGMQAGQAQMGYQQNAMEAQINKLASQWGMNYAQKEALRNQLMGVGGSMLTGPMTLNMMKSMQGMFGRAG